MQWTIRLKFLAVMSGLLAVCLGVYLFMAVTVFKSDKTQLVYDLNRSQVANLAAQVETGMNGVSEKLKLFAQLPPQLQDKMSEDLFSDDSDIVAVSIYKVNATEPIKSFTQKTYLETYGIQADEFKNYLGKTAVPFAEILRTGEDLWNASAAGGPPLIGYGRLVVVQDERGVPVDQWAVVGYVKLDRFLKSVSVVSMSFVTIANGRGEVLVQTDASSLAQKPSIAGDVFFKNALDSKTRLTVNHAESEGQMWLSATARAFKNQAVVIAKAPERQVFRVVRDLGVRTLLFGLIVLTLAILAAVWISRSLTQNLARLTERMEAVSEGDLSTSIQLKGRDETVRLAETFNQMIADLKSSRDALEEMNRELDLKVKDRTAQLEEQNLKVKEAQEALLRTTRLASVGEIAGRTAHEVLNPLTSLLTRAGLMQKRVSNDYQSQLTLLNEIREAWKKDYQEGGFEKLLTEWKSPSQIEVGKSLFEEDLDNLQAIAASLSDQSRHIDGDTQFIREEGNRIGKIINSMRRLGHVKSDVRTYSLHDILNDCCHIMADLFDQRSFKIIRHSEARADHVHADRDEIIQAVTNLMRNSYQALEDRGRDLGARGSLTIRTFNEGHQIVVDIEDNGAGIPIADQARLFEASFTTKSADEGTGLGLGISRRFVRSYGGEIEFVSSVPNERTIFRIKLPLKSSSKTGVAS